jgi:hypothetical protein
MDTELHGDVATTMMEDEECVIPIVLASSVQHHSEQKIEPFLIYFHYS